MYINYFNYQLEILNRRIFFSRKQNIMFLTTPKCGSQFIKLFCLLNFTKENPDLPYNDSVLESLRPQDITELIKNNDTEKHFREWKDNNTVTIEDLNNPNIKRYQLVRNPYNRLISYFKGATHSGGSDVKDTFEDTVKMIQNPHPVKLITKFNWDPKDRKEIKYKLPPIGYVQVYEHLFPQYSWLFSKYFKSIKLEDLDEVLKINFPDSIIPPKTAFKHHSQNLTSIKINNNIKDQIYKLYREDFKNFNYEK